MKRLLFKCLLFMICFGTVERFCHKKTRGFRLHKIRTSAPTKQCWETSPLSQEEINKFFSQKYTFLESGGECYAFCSEDGRYVLKLFKQHHMRKPAWTALLPRIWKTKIQHKYTRKQDLFYTSCKLAHDHFKERCGLLYLHLTPTTFLNRKLKIFDAIGAVHTIDLDIVPFALQEHASMAYQTLSHLVAAKEVDAAQVRLQSMIDLIVERCKAGLADHDARKRNFGFVGKTAIALDLGSFSYKQELKEKDAARKIFLLETMKLKQWVKKNTPELCEPLEEKINNHLNS